MAPDCIFNRPGYFGRCEWTLDERSLTIVPQSQAPEVYALREILGVGGEAYDIRVHYEAGTLNLTRVGADGAALLEALHRTWPPQRAEALRIAGPGTPTVLNGSWAPLAPDGDPAAKTTNVGVLLYEDRLVLAGDDADLTPVFVATIADVAFDVDTYAVDVRTWFGESHRFSKLGGQTEEFAQRLRTYRAKLALDAATTLATHLPALEPGPLAALAAVWPPGRLLNAATAEAVAPGFVSAWASGWLPSLPRGENAATLLSWAAAERTYIGYDRSGDLWILAGRGDHWVVQTLSAPNHETYRFVGDAELPVLVEQLLCAPQFSREALYLPLEELTGEWAVYEPAARHLGFLVKLRERFHERAIHRDAADLRADLDHRN